MKSQNGVVENYVFHPQIFLGEGPQTQIRTFYAPKGTHLVGKFGAMLPTDPDDISQSTPDFWPIFEFQALKNVGGRPIPNEVCISRRWSPSTNCEIFRGQRPLAPENEKVD